MKNKHVFLNGFMGAGKSKIGPILAQKMKINFYDLDKIIEQYCNLSIFDIFESEGEESFRKKEQAILFQLIREHKSSVIALGGGALINDFNLRQVQKTGTVIYIKSNPKAILDRVKHTSKRPLLNISRDENFEANMLKRIEELLNERKHIYESADVIIERDGLEPDQVAEMILKRFEND